MSPLSGHAPPNDNLMSGRNRTYTWMAENRPATVTSGDVIETYTYAAAGERVARTVSGVTTMYFQGIWEQIVGGASKRYYSIRARRRPVPAPTELLPRFI
jgi:YD repeat-containing protein